MRKFLIVAVFMLSACAVEANGPAFQQVTDQGRTDDLVRTFVFRDKATYLAQASYIRSPWVVIDGKEIGNLKNGGFVVADLKPGDHVVTIGAGSEEPTSKGFRTVPGADGYIEVFDKTRVQTSVIIGGVLGGAIGGAIAGAINDSNQPENEGRIWRVSFPVPSDAQPRLEKLFLSR